MPVAAEAHPRAFRTVMTGSDMGPLGDRLMFRTVTPLATLGFIALLTAALSTHAPPPQSTAQSTGLVGSDAMIASTTGSYGSATSHNWAGYAVSSTNHTVTFVNGTWVVPAVKGSCPSTTTQWAAFWVGIDGWGGKTVEQTGTSTICSGGTAYYQAWYEFYPAGPVTLSMTISPGDTIYAFVSFNPHGAVWTTQLKDLTNLNSGGSIHNQKGLARSTAEWVAEAPGKGTTGSKLYPLVDFGSVTFRHCNAVISGHTHSIGGFSHTKITMWNVANTATKAVPSLLSFGGTTFTVTWKSTGP